MKKIKERILYWGQLLLLPIYWLSFLFPRNKNIWLFGSTFGRRFADNPRYYFLYVSQKSKEGKLSYKGKPIRSIWISQDKSLVNWIVSEGYEAYYYHSLKGIWFALKGKVYFYDNYSKDINFWQSGGAIKFNMWHGVPLKKIQHDNVFDKVRHPKNKWDAWKSYPRTISDEKSTHYVLATSEFMKPIFSSAFKTIHVSTAGYPRIDGFAYSDIKNIYTAEENSSIDKIKGLLEMYDDVKMVYYMPTFRDSETKFFDVVNLQEFDKYLKEKHIVFCTKLHPKSRLKKEFDKIQGGNLVVIDAATDPYVFIPMSDVLVTDYSSIYFDYLFAEKPIVFFDYDLEQYLSDSREMYFDYDSYTPGIKAKNQQELHEALNNALSGIDDFIQVRELLKKKMYDNTDEAICGILTEEIISILK